MKKIVASILVRDQFVVNSTNFSLYKPIGKISHIIPRLEEWEVDEIVVLNLTHSQKPLDDFKSLFPEELLANLRTPLAYGGGISTSHMAEAIIAAGCERVVLSGTKWTPIDSRRISINLGDQAVLIHLPLVESPNESPSVYDSGELLLKYLESTPKDWGGELFLKDRYSDGAESRFEFFQRMLPILCELRTPILVGGGVRTSRHLRDLMELDYVNGVVIGSWLNRNELIIPRLKRELGKVLQLRDLVGFDEC